MTSSAMLKVYFFTISGFLYFQTLSRMIIAEEWTTTSHLISPIPFSVSLLTSAIQWTVKPQIFLRLPISILVLCVWFQVNLSFLILLCFSFAYSSTNCPKTHFFCSKASHGWPDMQSERSNIVTVTQREIYVTCKKFSRLWFFRIHIFSPFRKLVWHIYLCLLILFRKLQSNKS